MMYLYIAMGEPADIVATNNRYRKFTEMRLSRPNQILKVQLDGFPVNSLLATRNPKWKGRFHRVKTYSRYNSQMIAVPGSSVGAPFLACAVEYSGIEVRHQVTSIRRARLTLSIVARIVTVHPIVKPTKGSQLIARWQDHGGPNDNVAHRKIEYLLRACADQAIASSSALQRGSLRHGQWVERLRGGVCPREELIMKWGKCRKRKEWPDQESNPGLPQIWEGILPLYNPAGNVEESSTPIERDNGAPRMEKMLSDYSYFC
jgi:hypothetical protein